MFKSPTLFEAIAAKERASRKKAASPSGDQSQTQTGSGTSIMADGSFTSALSHERVQDQHADAGSSKPRSAHALNTKIYPGIVIDSNINTDKAPQTPSTTGSKRSHLLEINHSLSSPFHPRASASNTASDSSPTTISPRPEPTARVIMSEEMMSQDRQPTSSQPLHYNSYASHPNYKLLSTSLALAARHTETLKTNTSLTYDDISLIREAICTNAKGLGRDRVSCPSPFLCLEEELWGRVVKAMLRFSEAVTEAKKGVNAREIEAKNDGKEIRKTEEKKRRVEEWLEGELSGEVEFMPEAPDRNDDEGDANADSNTRSVTDASGREVDLLPVAPLSDEDGDDDIVTEGLRVVLETKDGEDMDTELTDSSTAIPGHRDNEEEADTEIHNHEDNEDETNTENHDHQDNEQGTEPEIQDHDETKHDLSASTFSLLDRAPSDTSSSTTSLPIANLRIVPGTSPTDPPLFLHIPKPRSKPVLPAQQPIESQPTTTIPAPQQSITIPPIPTPPNAPIPKPTQQPAQKQSQSQLLTLTELKLSLYDTATELLTSVLSDVPLPYYTTVPITNISELNELNATLQLQTYALDKQIELLCPSPTTTGTTNSDYRSGSNPRSSSDAVASGDSVDMNAVRLEANATYNRVRVRQTEEWLTKARVKYLELWTDVRCKLLASIHDHEQQDEHEDQAYTLPLVTLGDGESEEEVEQEEKCEDFPITTSMMQELDVRDLDVSEYASPSKYASSSEYASADEEEDNEPETNPNQNQEESTTIPTTRNTSTPTQEPDVQDLAMEPEPSGASSEKKKDSAAAVRGMSIEEMMIWDFNWPWIGLRYGYGYGLEEARAKEQEWEDTSEVEEERNHHDAEVDGEKDTSEVEEKKDDDAEVEEEEGDVKAENKKNHHHHDAQVYSENDDDTDDEWETITDGEILVDMPSPSPDTNTTSNETNSQNMQAKVSWFGLWIFKWW